MRMQKIPPKEKQKALAAHKDYLKRIQEETYSEYESWLAIAEQDLTVARLLSKQKPYCNVADYFVSR
jgi:hypothetical protein